MAGASGGAGTRSACTCVRASGLLLDLKHVQEVEGGGRGAGIIWTCVGASVVSQVDWTQWTVIPGSISASVCVEMIMVRGKIVG